MNRTLSPESASAHKIVSTTDLNWRYIQMNDTSQTVQKLIRCRSSHNRTNNANDLLRNIKRMTTKTVLLAIIAVALCLFRFPLARANYTYLFFACNPEITSAEIIGTDAIPEFTRHTFPFTTLVTTSVTMILAKILKHS